MTNPADIERVTGRKFNQRLSNVVSWRFGNKGALAVDAKAGFYFDHEASKGGSLSHLTSDTANAFRPQENAATPNSENRRWSQTAGRIWREARPIDGSSTEKYLRQRQCVVPQNDVKHHAGLWHNQAAQSLPAMVARITDFVTGSPLSLHLTFLHEDGFKADVQPQKKLLAGHAKQGGVVRLCSDDSVTSALGIAEGIKTALSVAAIGWQPMWAAVDAGNLANLPVLAGIECLTVFADQDKAGMGAAQTVCSRWGRAGREARIVAPNDGDWNDAITA